MAEDNREETEPNTGHVVTIAPTMEEAPVENTLKLPVVDTEASDVFKEESDPQVLGLGTEAVFI